MRLNTRNIVWALLSILFIAGSIWIHYLVKIDMTHGDFGSAALFQEGDAPPDFSTTDIQGRQVVLSVFQQRKVVVVNFWATGRSPCLMAILESQEIYDKFAARGVESMAINVGEDPVLARRFVERNDYTFRVVVDQNRSIGARFGLSAMPMQVVIVKNERIAWTRVGYTAHEMEKLRALLEDLTLAHPFGGSAQI